MLVSSQPNSSSMVWMRWESAWFIWHPTVQIWYFPRAILLVVVIALPLSEHVMKSISYSRSEEHTSELQSPDHLVCRLLLEKKTMNHQTAARVTHTRSLSRSVPSSRIPSHLPTPRVHHLLLA